MKLLTGLLLALLAVWPSQAAARNPGPRLVIEVVGDSDKPYPAIAVGYEPWAETDRRRETRFVLASRRDYQALRRTMSALDCPAPVRPRPEDFYNEVVVSEVRGARSTVLCRTPSARSCVYLNSLRWTGAQRGPDALPAAIDTLLDRLGCSGSSRSIVDLNALSISPGLMRRMDAMVEAELHPPPPSPDVRDWIEIVSVGGQNHTYPRFFVSKRPLGLTASANTRIALVRPAAYRRVLVFNQRFGCTTGTARVDTTRYPEFAVVERAAGRQAVRCIMTPERTCAYLRGLAALPADASLDGLKRDVAGLADHLRCQPPYTPPAAEALPDVNELLRSVVRETDRRWEPTKVRRETAEQACKVIARTARRSRSRETLPLLVVLLHDSDPRIRMWAALAIGHIGKSARSAQGELRWVIADTRPSPETVLDTAGRPVTFNMPRGNRPERQAAEWALLRLRGQGNELDSPCSQF